MRPGWPPALVARGLCYARLGDHKEAVREWREVERVSPRDLGNVSLCDRGLSLSIIGEYEQAIQVLDHALEEEPSAEALYNRAVAVARMNGVSDADDELARAAKAVAEADNEVVRHYGAGGICALRGEADAAFQALSEACALPGSNARMWASSDPAWENLREYPEFVAAVREEGERI